MLEINLLDVLLVVIIDLSESCFCVLENVDVVSLIHESRERERKNSEKKTRTSRKTICQFELSKT